MAVFASSDFNGTSGDDLSTYDAAWVEHTSYASGSMAISNAGRARGSSSNASMYYHTGTPSGADYAVTSVMRAFETDGGLHNCGICARVDTAANTMYLLRYFGSTSDNWGLFRIVAGTSTQLGSNYAMSWTSGTDKTVELIVDGAQITCIVDSVTIIDETDPSPITAAGKIGIRCNPNGSPGDAFGIHWDSISADDALSGGGDTTAPILSSPTGAATGSTTATVGATTDEANGTQYAFVSTSATPPSAADLRAGTGAAWAGSITISSTGANTHSATGLAASTAYYAHLIHTDAAANDSNIVTSAQFTTPQAEVIANQSGPKVLSQAAGRASFF